MVLTVADGHGAGQPVVGAEELISFGVFADTYILPPQWQ
jgi:hypothetical protein